LKTKEVMAKYLVWPDCGTGMVKLTIYSTSFERSYQCVQLQVDKLQSTLQLWFSILLR